MHVKIIRLKTGAPEVEKVQQTRGRDTSFLDLAPGSFYVRNFFCREYDVPSMRNKNINISLAFVRQICDPLIGVTIGRWSQILGPFHQRSVYFEILAILFQLINSMGTRLIRIQPKCATH